MAWDVKGTVGLIWMGFKLEAEGWYELHWKQAELRVRGGAQDWRRSSGLGAELRSGAELRRGGGAQARGRSSGLGTELRAGGGGAQVGGRAQDQGRSSGPGGGAQDRGVESQAKQTPGVPAPRMGRQTRSPSTSSRHPADLPVSLLPILTVLLALPKHTPLRSLSFGESSRNKAMQGWLVFLPDLRVSHFCMVSWNSVPQAQKTLVPKIAPLFSHAICVSSWSPKDKSSHTCSFT